MKKIVLVEDDQMLAELYQTRLELAGFTCLVANDGLTGLAVIEKELPDLVLLDLMLPYVSGDEILRAMRESDWGKDIKAIFLTNISESEAPEGIQELGFEQYIIKANLVNDQLAEIVKQYINPNPSPSPTAA